jgi:hypothetical protein
VYQDYRFTNTPLPWLALLPNEASIGFGASDEEAAEDALGKANPQRASEAWLQAAVNAMGNHDAQGEWMPPDGH